MTLARLGSDNTLIMCLDLCEIVHKTASIIVREYYEVIKNHVRHLVFEKPTSRILKIAYDFEEFHGIPYVF